MSKKGTEGKDEGTEQGGGTPAPSQTSTGGAAAAPTQAQTQQQITISDENIQAHYANFCRVSSTPEELVLDLGLNPQPYATGPQTIPVSQRIILNHYTAKRLLSALSMALQRHEQAFGVLETDVRKRVRNQ
ncbi:MAG: DUF3467 domain-containing protein [Planctomycetes bacterium]|nr:DUF3467 domain-containing protein [Planctomycetota bacterium]